MKPCFPPRNLRALTAVEVLVAMAVIALAVVILVPTLARPRSRAMRINCVNNLKQVGLSFRIWAGDNGDKYPMHVPASLGGTMDLVLHGSPWPHLQVMSNELNTPKVIVCPEDKTRRNASFAQFAATSTPGRYQNHFVRNWPVSYFVGVDAAEYYTNHLLVGDDNLLVSGKGVTGGLLNLWTNSAVGWHKPRHPKGGNVCFADGSVQQINSTQLREALVRTGVATNRLAMP